MHKVITSGVKERLLKMNRPERMEGEDWQTYKARRKAHQAAVKAHLRGRITWPASNGTKLNPKPW